MLTCVFCEKTDPEVRHMRVSIPIRVLLPAHPGCVEDHERAEAEAMAPYHDGTWVAG